MVLEQVLGAGAQSGMPCTSAGASSPGPCCQMGPVPGFPSNCAALVTTAQGYGQDWVCWKSLSGQTSRQNREVVQDFEHRCITLGAW